MSKKKWKQEQKAILKQILDLCKSNHNMGIDRGELCQEQHKDEFLKICQDAYKHRFCGEEFGYYKDDPNPCYMRATPKRPQVDGDTIWSYTRDDGWVAPGTEADDTKDQILRQVTEWWDAWVYAWDHQPKKRQYIHKLTRTNEAT